MMMMMIMMMMMMMMTRSLITTCRSALPLIVLKIIFQNGRKFEKKLRLEHDQACPDCPVCYPSSLDMMIRYLRGRPFAERVPVLPPKRIHKWRGHKCAVAP